VRWHRVGFSLLLALEVTPSKASRETQKLAKDITGQRMPAEQRRLVPKQRGGVSRVLSARANDRTSRCSHEGGVRVAHRRELETYVSRRAVQPRGRRLRSPNRAMLQIFASLFNAARKLRLRFPTKVMPSTLGRSSPKVPENQLATSCPAKSGRTKRSAKTYAGFAGDPSRSRNRQCRSRSTSRGHPDKHAVSEDEYAAVAARNPVEHVDVEQNKANSSLIILPLL
jgi:hypothetical protein